MKNLLCGLFCFCWLLGMGLLAACGGHGNGSGGVIPGTYVNHTEGTLSIADDTLLIVPVEHTPGSFLVGRHTGFRRIREGKVLPLEHKVGSFTGIWDAQKQALQLNENGILLFFLLDTPGVRIQNSTYRRL